MEDRYARTTPTDETVHSLTRPGVLDLKNAKKMIAKIPDARLAQIDNSYHHVMLDNPAGLIAALKDFVADLK